MTALTLFDLVIRSMRKNIKHYYLYFFALIFSVVLYFVFATLQHDPSVVARSGGSMGAAFKVAGILLLFIAGIFVVYANAIFLKRRSREIGLYQLIGLTKGSVARLLIIENTLLSAGALAIGIGAGILVSRVFLLLLMKLIGFDGFIEVNVFNGGSYPDDDRIPWNHHPHIDSNAHRCLPQHVAWIIQCGEEGRASEKAESLQVSFSSNLRDALHCVWILVVWRMLNALLFVNMLVVLATVILGTYLLFRVTISWLLYQIRKRKQGHLGLYNSLSLAPLMHRMKGNANSLTIITVLSAMTLTMLAVSYSLYYSTEKETRLVYPVDFLFMPTGDELRRSGSAAIYRRTGTSRN